MNYIIRYCSVSNKCAFYIYIKVEIAAGEELISKEALSLFYELC